MLRRYIDGRALIKYQNKDGLIRTDGSKLGKEIEMRRFSVIAAYFIHPYHVILWLFDVFCLIVGLC